MNRHAKPALSMSPRGLTLTEAVVAIGSAAVLLSVGTTVLAYKGGTSDSMYKLAEFGQAHACYANDWNERQWTALPDNAGAFADNCGSYTATDGCPRMVLGFGSTGAVWGYFLNCGGLPGNCSTWARLRPMNFSVADRTTGAFRQSNVWGFREYVSKNYYSNEWFSADDPVYAAAAAQFNSPYEFAFPVAGLPGGFAQSSFCLSPAAMLNPGVLRAKAEGGFQAPNAFIDSYRSPTVTQCMHPALKSRMTEYGWFRDAPSDGLAFNAGRESAPFTLFFDGSVQATSMAQAELDDAMVRAGNKFGDGLWSDDTTYGIDAWQDTKSVDGLRSGFHMLTTGGILGRDLLTRE